jgi:nitrogen regulatory protein PII
MTFSNQKLLTIITESRLELPLTENLDKLGAQGWTISDCRGKGHRGVRDASWAANSNIRIDIVCNDILIKAISEFLKKEYFNNYAMILFVGDIEVLRTNKF